MSIRTRPFALARLALLLALAWLGTAVPAAAAVTAVVTQNQLRIASDEAGDAITLRPTSDEANIQVFRGGTLVGSFPRNTFTAILLNAGGGDDELIIELNSVLFPISHPMFVEAGDGNDIIRSGSGADFILGGAGNDVLEGGPGNDLVSGGTGDDRFVFKSRFGPFSPDDGSDIVDGEEGTDTLDVTGLTLAEEYVLAPSGQRALLSESFAVYSISVGTTERLEVDMLDGDDEFEAQAGLPTLTTLVIDAGEGEDVVFGGAGDDVILGGNGNDSLFGRGGADIVSGGGGNDTVDGDAGDDALVGGAGDDSISGDSGNDRISGNAGADFVTGGAGDDRIIWTIGDGTDTGVLGDLGVDVFELHGTSGNDSVSIENGAGVVQVLATPSGVSFAAIERLEMTMLGGNDIVSIGGPTEHLLELVTIAMGAGNDTVSAQSNSAPIVVDGGPAEIDTLHYQAFDTPVDVQPATLSVAGQVKVTYTEIALNVSNTLTALPTITIVSPTTQPTTTAAAPFITLGGIASDDTGLQQVTWMNDRGGSGTANGTTTWSITDVPLQPGANRIVVSATDASGNRTFDQITVTVATLTYSLAEGATGTFFDLDVLIANPTTTAAPVTVTFLRQDGPPITQTLTLAPTSRTTIHVDEVPGLESQGGVSTVVTSTTGVPLVVERTMFWDANYYGSHGGTAVDGPRTRWLFAEGSEGFFNTFVLLANSGATTSTVTLTFLREGSTPHAHTVTVPPNARVTVAANGIPELVGRSFSIVVDATTPIVAERAMYFGAARLFDGGHESAGVAAASQVWFLPEGATGPFFETFVLIGNPNPAAATAVVSFLTDTGQTITRNKTIPANGRLTINVEHEDPALANAAVSTVVTASQPVVVERAMYWPGPPSTWTEAHNSFGTTVASAKWGLAEGRVGMGRGFQTYILLANSNPTAAQVRITFLRSNGATVVKTFTVNPSSRYTVAVNTAAPELQDEAFGALIEVTNGLAIGVERALYSDADGLTWAAGTNALATRLP